MDQKLLEDTIHELAARDRYALTSAQVGMHIRNIHDDIPEREVVAEMWGEHAPPDLEAMLVLAMVERSVRHHLEAGTVLQGARASFSSGRGLQGLGGCHEHRGDGSWGRRAA